ncbi:AMP-binding protein [Rhodococcus artemisiae]|uniref:AMP-binding protein n=1 Tax=Rhodococcus artemisiae TaxID=714159 RepID=A0ABU7LAC8_9NOCA|nr:AMP-binding protein [Rhodococcus artemisiae]MEE2058501.1 AMP-binding protein [Rhodococcus artemisiae]
MPEWTLGAVFDAVADAVPDRTMTVCKQRRTSFGEASLSTRRFANFLADRGFGAHTPSGELDRWECGQDRIAMIMYNDRYPEVLIGCLKARTVPVNINPRYTARELRDLLAYLQPRGIVYHRSFGPVLAEIIDDVDLLVCVDDDSDTPELDGAVSYETAVEMGDPDRVITGSPDDVMMLCTGGTTGSPKAVLWRQSDVYVSSMNGADHDSAEPLQALTALTGQKWFAVSPLSHAAGTWTAFAGLLAGQTVVLYDDRNPFDARDTLDIVERENVALMTIVGDAYAGPLVREMRHRRHRLDSLLAIGTGGAATNPVHRRAFLELLPHVTVVEGYGSTETGGMGFGRSSSGAEVDTFAPMPGGTAVSQDRTRLLRPGDDEIGWAARTGRVPLGYFRDRDATERTFPVVDGVRMAIPGDRVTMADDGTLRLLGRDSLVVNTGGEKVFVEEVEEVLRVYPGVADALVVGRPSERWGQEVVALVHLERESNCTAEELGQACRVELAGFKIPKEFVFVPEIRRLGNGKADYRWAAQQAQSRETGIR